MNAFICLLKDKTKAKEVLEKIKIYLDQYLKLELNSKTNYYPNALGCNFCGYRIFETHKLLRIRSKRKIKNNIKMWNKLSKEGRLDRERMNRSWQSWLSHANHANTYNLQNRLRLMNINVVKIEIDYSLANTK